IWKTSLKGKWFVLGSAALMEYSPVFGSYPGLQLYSTWHCPHCSLASYFSRRAIFRNPPRNSRTSIFVALGSLCQRVSFSGRVRAPMRPSRTIRGFAACGSWHMKQFIALERSLTNSTTFEVLSHFAFESLSPRNFHLRIWSWVLHWRQVGLAAAALSGMKGLCSFDSGYRSSRRSHALRTPVVPEWQEPQLIFACSPPVLSAWISSWQSKHFSSLTGDSFTAMAVLERTYVAAPTSMAIQTSADLFIRLPPSV